MTYSTPVVSHGSSGGSSGSYHAASSYPIVESSANESYPVEYPTESYPTESYPAESYPTEGFSEGYPVESAIDYSDSGYTEIYSEPTYTEGVPVDNGYSVPTEDMDPSLTPAPVSPGGVAPAIDPASSQPTLADPAEAANSSQADARIVVSLPSNATLFVNGIETKSSGSKRQFISRGLETGLRYPYDVKAVMDVNGRKVVKAKKVLLRAGDHNQVAFEFEQPIETKLTVRVPEDAKLTIAGAATSSTGSERKFTTARLSPGQTWSDYEVVVTMNRNGQQVSKSQTIDLRAGENRTLTFDFDLEAVASLK